MNVFNAIQFVLCGVELSIMFFQPENALLYVGICFGLILALCIPQTLNDKEDTTL